MRTLGWSDAWFVVAAAQWTILLTLIGLVGGGVLGLALAMARTSESRVLSALAAGYIRVFQSTPLLLQLFLIYFGLSILGFRLSPLTSAAIGLILNAAAFLGDIWRGCIQAVPTGQSEAAKALGIGWFHRFTRIVAPQAARIAVPPTVGFLVQLVKNTSLTAIIGFVEITRSAQIINNATFRPFAVFSIAAAAYFAICWPLSLYSRRLERRLHHA